MLSYKLIILSNMFPNNMDIKSGTFVQEQVNSLESWVDEKIIVLSPIPYSHKILWKNPKYKKYDLIKDEDFSNDYDIFYPRFISVPGGTKTLFLDSFFVFLSVYNKIKKIKKNTNAEIIIHAHKIIPTGFTAILLKKFLNVKTVVTIHGSDLYRYSFSSPINRKLAKLSLKYNDEVITVSNDLKRQAKTIYNRSINVVTNGVNKSKFINNIKMDEINEIYNSKKIILFVGSFIVEKGIKELLNSIKKLKEDKRDDFILLMIGGGPLKEYIFKFINKNNLNRHIEVIGLVNHDKIPKWFHLSDIFVLPSHNEGMPTVMFEAGISDNALIITDVGGVNEIIKNKKNGLLIEKKNENQLYESLQLLLDDKNLRRNISNNLFKLINESYTWNHNAMRMNDIYNRLIK